VLPALMRLAQDPAHLVRIAALRALTRLQHPSSHSAILAALDDEHWDVRSAAAVAAGEFRLMEALPKLDSLLDADNWILRFNTALSLYQLGVAGRRVLLHRTRKPDVAGRTANLVLSEKGVASLMPTW
jgi:HEAT repeat protein